MTETPLGSTESTAETPREDSMSRRDEREHGPSRLYQVLAWVGIIAGVVFIVMVIFVSGLIAGRSSGGYHGWHRGYESGQERDGSAQDDCPMSGRGGMMGPGQSFPTMMPPQRPR